MPTPSLLIVPSRWKTGNPGKLYSQIPTNGNGDFNVTGVVTGAGNIGTRVNDLGYIETITTSGTPRLDYYTSSGTPGCPALLVEPSGTNGILNSADTTTSWTLGANLTSGAIDVIGVSGNNLTVAVSGSFIGLSSGRIGRASNNVALASGSTYTISFFVKRTGTHTVGGYYAVITGAAGGDLGGGFDVSGSFSSGSVFASAGVTGRIRRVEQWGTDVFRCSETFTMTASGTLTSFFLAPISGVTLQANPTVGSQLGFAAPQIELGSVPTSFIPTTTGTVTRAADVISVSGAVSGSIGQAAGTIYCEFVQNNSTSINRIIAIDNGTNSDNGFDIITTAAGAIRITYRVLGVAQCDITTTVATAVGVTYKVAFAYAQNDFVIYVNGIQEGTDSSGNTTLTPSRIILGGRNDGTGSARIRAAALYTTRLTNADLMLLTMPGNNTYLPQAVWNNYLSRPGNTEVPDCLYTRHADLLDV